jgi:hypothetical protein
MSTRPAYAVDCEMVLVEEEPGASPTPAVVSIGVVDKQMENILYSRIRISKDAKVLNDSFVRVVGGLRPNWLKGIELSVAQNLLRQFTSAVSGILVGWELQSDLKALGFVKASAQARDEINFPPHGKRKSLPLAQQDALKQSKPVVWGADAKPPPTPTNLGGIDTLLRYCKLDSKAVRIKQMGFTTDRSILDMEYDELTAKFTFLSGSNLKWVRKGLRLYATKFRPESSWAEGFSQRKTTPGAFVGDTSTSTLTYDRSGLGHAKVESVAQHRREIEATPECDICELTDYYRTAKYSSKCKLSEAYSFIFARHCRAHDAGDDARMTMELYNHWLNLGCPRLIPVALKFYKVQVKNFSMRKSREYYLWKFLRHVDRRVATEKVDEMSYQVRFRQEDHLLEYLREVETRICDEDDLSIQWTRISRMEIDCVAFTICITEVTR